MGINLQFRRLTEDREVSGKHPIISDSRGPQNIIFVGLRNGQQALFSLLLANPISHIERHRSSNNRLFLRAPPWAKYYSFDETVKTLAGWDYKVIWLPKPPKEEEGNNEIDKM
jgi:hypothetical protein